MRRALLAAVLCAASCGEPAPAPAANAAPAQAPAKPPPHEVAFDDAALEVLVFDSARSGKTEALASVALPPRCDRVRAAVHALHAHLLGAMKPPPDRAQLLAALDALAKTNGGASAKSLAPLVAAWRGWTEEQAAAEAALARRAALGFDALARRKPDVAALSAAIKGSGSAPPMSPAAAQLAFLHAAAAVLSVMDQAAVPQDVEAALARAEQQFGALGWPGGFGSSADVLAKRLLAADPRSRIGTHLADRAQAAFARSGDEVRASLVFLTLSDAAERLGDDRTAEYYAAAGRERLAPTGARGRELFDVTLRRGTLAQRLGRQATAARDLRVAWDEACAAQLPAPEIVETAERLATSLFHLGRFDEAKDAALAASEIHDRAVAAGAAPVEPGRTTLAEIAAQAFLETARPSDALRLYREAAARQAAAIATDESAAQRRDTDELLAAQAQIRSGDTEGAARTIREVTSRPTVGPPALAHAASLWREAKRLDDAQVELTRAEAAGGPVFKEALGEERARLAEARGDTAGARALFEKAVRRVKKDADAPVGWEAARVLRDWARMELAAGRLCEASDLAGRAILELRDAGLDLELDRARKLYVDIERRRLWFGEAAKAADQRVAAGLGGDGALLDAFLIRLELALAHAKDGDKALVAAAAAFPEGWGRDAATTIAAAVAAGTPRAAVKVPAGCPPRWKRLADVAAGTSDSAIGLAHHCGTEEPELRRWAAGRVDPKGGVVWVREAIEQRRGTDDAGVKGVIVADDDQAVLLVEPLADGLHVLVLRGRRPDLDFAVAKDDGGLAAFWDAVHVDPSAERLASAAKRVSSALFPDAVAKSLDGVKRLWISVSEPVGPLPFDLLPFGDGLLIDRFDVLTVKSAAELVRARARRAPPMLSALKSPDATLDARYEVVSFGAIGDAARMQIFLGVASRQAEGRDVAEALREAKLALRAETKDAPPAKGVPAWAALLLRGAP